MANQPQQPDTALHNASHLMQYHDLIESIVAALDARDAYTASHSDRVADMVLVLAAALGLDEDETTRIHMAAHLHDIGKIAVPDSVLRKAGPLTRPEWEEMRRHPVTGYEILRKIDDFKEIAILVRHHHERWDGRGYPDGLSGLDIPPGSRVIAVADSIDAMMSSRSYRPAMTSAACRREIEKNSGIMYDPRVAAAALDGAQSALELSLSMAGILCLWSGVMEILNVCGLSRRIAALFRPLLRRLLPNASRDEETLAAVSANVSANLLGLGNAATPLGIQAARRMARNCGGTASDELCLLVVLNTASIQLLPTTVASVRAAFGSAAPFDILPAVWISSLASVTVGLLTARLLSRRKGGPA